MKLKALALSTVTAFSVLFPSIVLAVNWVKIAGNSEAQTYLDIDSVKRRGKMVQYWNQVLLTSPNEDGIKGYKYFESLDCSNGNAKILRAITYDQGGVVLSDRPVKSSPVFSAIPGSMGESLFKRVCRH